MSILVLESDPTQAAAIRHIVCNVLETELVLVDSIDEALEMLHKTTPDLVLLPQLVTPAEEAKLVTFLRDHPRGAHVETLISPVLGSPPEHTKSARSWLKWSGSRTSADPADTDEGRAFAERLEWSLRSARDRRQPVVVEETPVATDQPEELQADESVTPVIDEPVAIEEEPPPAVELVASHEEPPPAVERVTATEQRWPIQRAHRRLPARELQALRAARLKNGPLVNIRNVSEGGALIESDTPLERDSEQVLELITDLLQAQYVPFRVVRCEIATSGATSRYLGACAFLTPITLDALRGGAEDVHAPDASASSAPPVNNADRRRYLRVDGPFEGSRRGLIDVPIMINNLSEGGCFVDSRLEVEPGHRLTLVVQTPDGDRITVTAEVVHNQEGIGFAVRFVEMEDETRNGISKLVAARTKTLAALQGMTA